jgi:tetratricopeptide (TPR) repeat protein
MRHRGASYAKKGDYGQALADLSRAIALNPKDGKAYFVRGAVHRVSGNRELAIEDYQQAMRADPGLSRHVESELANLDSRTL